MLITLSTGPKPTRELVVILRSIGMNELYPLRYLRSSQRGGGVAQFGPRVCQFRAEALVIGREPSNPRLGAGSIIDGLRMRFGVRFGVTEVGVSMEIPGRV